MDKKTILKEFGKKLLDIRASLGHKPFEMADRIGAYRTSYYRYEVLAFFHRYKEEHQLDPANTAQSLELEE